MHYAITDLQSAESGNGTNTCASRQAHLLRDLSRWAADAVHIVQLRETTLEDDEIFALASAAVSALNRLTARVRPNLLIHSRPDIAIAAEASGVHLTSRAGELRPAQVRQLFARAGLQACTVSVSCHTLDEVLAARRNGADLVLFGPVFGKVVDGKLVAPASGLLQLRAACEAAAPVPVLALGSISVANQASCLAVGAAGIAGIRLFASNGEAQESALPQAPDEHEKLKR